ncbi:MAG: hypothetical protein AAB596_01580 [Patescibacteria group bacterium]
MKKAAVVAFAFGTPDTILSNLRIARIALQKARKFSIPIYTQLDIRIKEPGIKVKYTDEEPGNPPPTLRIARGAAKWAKEQDLRELWIVAAKPHLKRCLRNLKYACREAGISPKVGICGRIDEYSEDEWYCPDSTQARVRSKKDWCLREWILNHMPMFIYKRVAS